MHYSVRPNRECVAPADLGHDGASAGGSAPLFGLLDYDPACDRLTWSAALAELTGLPPCDATRLSDLEALIHPDDRARIKAGLMNSLKPDGSGQFREEFRICRNVTGEVRWLSGRLQTSFTDTLSGRQAVRSTGILEDITERKRADDTLRDEHDDFLGFLHLTNVGVAQTDVAARRFVRVNPALCAMTGYSEAELLALRIHDLDHPDDRPLTDQAFVSMTEGVDSYEVDKRYVRKDGSVVWVHVSGDVVRDANGAPVRTVAVIQNISPRKDVEAALRESEERFRLMADHTPVIVWVTDTTGGLEFVNREYQSYFGVGADQIAGSAWPVVLHPDDAAEYRQTFRAALRAQTAFHAEARVRRCDDQWRTLLNYGIPRYSPTGEFLGLIGTSLDVTDQRRLLQQERTAARQKDEFIAVLAHELRNPLAPIRTAALLLKNASTHPATLGRCATVIERQVAHMARLLEDLLDVSRLSRGTLILRRTPLLLKTALDDAIEAALPLIEQQRQRLTVEGADVPISLDADPARLTQIFSNLLNNAAKYTRPGGDIRVTVGTDRGRVRVSVVDTGIGIAPDMLERVFDLFAQVDRSGQAGLGIGLALARRLVRLHGGTLAVSSRGIGHGSEFIVSLPLLHHEDATSGSAAGASSAANQPRRVLIADDNADAADMLAMLFTLQGCETRTVHDGGSAVRVAAEFTPELILLDIGMPDLDGYETCRRIRAGNDLPTPLIVAITGWGQDEDRRRSAEAGFDRHLVKPVPPELLTALLAKPRPSEALDGDR